MYSSDIMNTLIIIFNKYNKNIVFRDCQIFIEKKGDPFGVILLNALPTDNPLINMAAKTRKCIVLIIANSQIMYVC